MTFDPTAMATCRRSRVDRQERRREGERGPVVAAGGRSTVELATTGSQYLRVCLLVFLLLFTGVLVYLRSVSPSGSSLGRRRSGKERVKLEISRRRGVVRSGSSGASSSCSGELSLRNTSMAASPVRVCWRERERKCVCV